MKMEVWIEGSARPIGVLSRNDDLSLRFTCAREADRPLSLSLPLRSEPYGDADCRGYFANLLFEGPELGRVMDSYRLDRGDVGGLLWHLGADCPGAVSITPEGAGPGKTPGRFPQDYDLLDEARLHAILLSLHLHRRLPDGERDKSPVAGVQGKIAVVMHDGAFYLPAAGSRAPTTHILKVSPASEPQITVEETALLAIASGCGIDTAETRPFRFGIGGRRINAILSTRFDREVRLAGREGLITRVHAEDLCQALGLAPGLKYERNSDNPDHRFSAAAVARIAARARAPALFQRDFLTHTLFNLLVGNSDNHGKNGSVIHGAGGTVLAPLYDVVPVFMDRNVTHQLAFRHGAAEFAEDLTPDNLSGLLSDLGYRRPPLEQTIRQMARLAGRIAEASGRLAPKGLADGLYAQAGVLEAALGVNFGLPKRDYFDRASRDDIAAAGWWDPFS
ncbi:HipA domain-containing protein [Pseudogemmobacter humi]|uniref:Serine/threonine-protein kinase HipA n=1 Tax=Pseudogemmobacter humi TaxID=2483812 RepID=A0A3P5Y0F0_9RHOB|nr:HipA domain-containing protein [Pseudogemmobacter humi]VDC33919.1 Serine/threonine-protein kinase HipA [Pseudogemmobacter humi]